MAYLFPKAPPKETDTIGLLAVAQRAVHDLYLLDAGIISLCVNVHLYY